MIDEKDLFKDDAEVEAEEAEEAEEAAEVVRVAEEAAATKAAESGEASAPKPRTAAQRAAEDRKPAVTDEDSGVPKRWYVVHTYSGHENKVRENVQKMINQSAIFDHFGQIIVPTEEVAEMTKGKKTISTRSG